MVLERFRDFKNFTKTDTNGTFDDRMSFHYFVNAQIKCKNNDPYAWPPNVPTRAHSLVIDFAKCWSDMMDSCIVRISHVMNGNSSAKDSIESKGQRKTTQPPINSAYWFKKNATDPSCLTDLLISLKDKGFVADETELKEFKKIFNNTSPIQPIKWLTTISDLAFFIKYIHLDLKAIDYLGNEIWKVTACLFVDSNGDQFPSSRFRAQKKPARADSLIKIASHLV
jgi:hypothetical protein